MDLGLSVLEIGYEAARFPALTVIHLIPDDRLTEDYIAKVIQSVRAGTLLLSYLRGVGMKPRAKFALWLDRLRARRLPPRHRRFMMAEIKGELQARELIMQLSDK